MSRASPSCTGAASGGGGRGPHSSGEVDRCGTWQGSRGRRNVRFPRTQDAHARFTRAAKGSCQHGVTRATGGACAAPFRPPPSPRPPFFHVCDEPTPVVRSKRQLKETKSLLAH